ncbi:hypothetical protein JR334_07510 [Clostridia bacterium]|nr:hypothetical protein JR334_07510 [Clostridia bacterium]
MTTEQFEREKNYQVTLYITKSMLEKGLIDKKDFAKIRAKLVKKYKPIIGSL